MKAADCGFRSRRGSEVPKGPAFRPSVKKLIAAVRLAGAVAAAILILTGAHGVLAQVQTKDQQNCINSLNKDAVKVAATQGKENAACVKNAGKGKVIDAQGCLTADSKGKVAKAAAGTEADFASKCETLPDFGVPAGTSGATINSTAVDQSVALVADIFGAPLDDVIVDCNSDKDGCKCQAAVVKDYEKNRRYGTEGVSEVQEDISEGWRLWCRRFGSLRRGSRDGRVDHRRLQGEDRQDGGEACRRHRQELQLQSLSRQMRR